LCSRSAPHPLDQWHLNYEFEESRRPKIDTNAQHHSTLLTFGFSKNLRFVFSEPHKKISRTHSDIKNRKNGPWLKEDGSLHRCIKKILPSDACFSTYQEFLSENQFKSKKRLPFKSRVYHLSHVYRFTIYHLPFTGFTTAG